MKLITHNQRNREVTRRDFLRGGSVATLMTMLGGVELKAQDKPAAAPPAEEPKRSSPPVNCGLIGCGVWGREILATLAKLPNAPVVAVCDTYEPMLKRAKDAAPNAETFTDYRKLLEKKDCPAVIVATPSHQHKPVVLEALQAGKHVYCEAPLASTVEDAVAIAKAAKAAVKQYFQVGLQLRADKQRHFLLKFIRSGATGALVKSRAQWSKKQTWRRTSPNPEREKELNWRLASQTSPGLIGEVGIHQVDELCWFMKQLPSSVTGFGSILFHKDERDVGDTVQAVFGFADGASLSYEATIANSFDSDYEVLYGSDAAIMVRGPKAWMFKEADAPLLGWEVYAKKTEFYKETGIVLTADASKIIAHSEGDSSKPELAGPTPLQQALDAFVYNSDLVASSVQDFADSFNINDTKALAKFLDGVMTKSRLPAATYQDGLEATICVLKANEAIQKGQRIKIEKAWFEV